MLNLIRPALAATFLVAVGYYVHVMFPDVAQPKLLIFAAVVGGYMALNIGANDVANNVGPAVGAFAITLVGAVALAAIFEAAGALIAGGDVVKTVKKGIIDPTALESSQVYIWVMGAALLGGAIWLNIATALGAPVSTTHSIVGGVMGAAIAAAGWATVNWASMGAIAASWVISPVLGGLIAASLLFVLQRTVYDSDDMRGAAARAVPILTSIMAFAFASYLAIKGLKHVVKIGLPTALIAGAVIAVITYAIAAPRVRQRVQGMNDTRDDINLLFTIPLIFGAALLSFAHGANDVANAIGPLAGIFDVMTREGVAVKVAIPLWIMIIGAGGLALGLALFGPRLIRTVGSEITELDRARAFCVALSAAVTVLIASQLGLPVSSTHVALGAVFGVGFLREYLDSRVGREIEKVLNNHDAPDHSELEVKLHRFYDATPDEKETVLKELKKMGRIGLLTRDESKKLRKLFRRKLVKRQIFAKIVSAWLITVPISAGLAAVFYFMLRGMMLP